MTQERDYFEFRDHTADLLVHIEAVDLAGLLRQAGQALYAAVGQPAASEQVVETQLIIEADDSETLLHDWMGELLYRLETRGEWYRQFEFHHCKPVRAEATAHGVIVDFETSQLDREVKAITIHDLNIERVKDGLRVDVVLDI